MGMDLQLDKMMKGLKKDLVAGSFEDISQRSSRQLVLKKGQATVTINVQIDRPKLPDSDKVFTTYFSTFNSFYSRTSYRITFCL